MDIGYASQIIFAMRIPWYFLEITMRKIEQVNSSKSLPNIFLSFHCSHGAVFSMSQGIHLVTEYWLSFHFLASNLKTYFRKGAINPLFWKIKPPLGQKTLGHTTRKPKGGPLDKRNIFFKKVLQIGRNMAKKIRYFSLIKIRYIKVGWPKSKN